MSGVKSEHDIATAAQGEMADVVATIKSILSKVTSAVDAAKAGFQGDAAAAFQGAANAWDGEANRLNGILNEFESQVGTGIATFKNLDSENESGFKTLTNLS
ncbi:WXG100 family type VII secretion target [Nocardia sp. NPDC127526]|uniref:WXG100 family type VII secretion target n=1 Tax=Nocardia sp. NPDC127526 TaxID=3345393 RepID=UPI00363FB001